MTEFAWRLWHRLRWGHPYYTTTFSRTFNHCSPCARCRAATRPAEEPKHVGPHFVGAFSDRATNRTCPACAATRPAEDAGERP